MLTLTRALMGGLCLAILWVNTLLVVAAAWQQLAALVRLRGDLGRVLRGRVTRGEGGALAVLRVDQVGRAAADGETIVFHDRSAAGEVRGGALEVEGSGEVLVPAQGEAGAEVWLDAALVARAGACPSTEAYERAVDPARKARGFSRTLVAEVGVGATVYASGTLRREAEGQVLAPPPGGRLLVSTVDPRAFCARKAALAAAFIVAVLLLAAACTAVALWPPVFGTVSTVGGALCLVFFLLVQPAGTALRDAVLVPGRAPVRGRWARPEAAGRPVLDVAP
jgi:hypothetical protein